MKKVFLLVAINAKYIHSSLAVRSLEANCYKGDSLSGSDSVSVKTEEFTINQTEGFILSEIYKYKPDFIGFSCYIWNIEIIMRLTGQIKKVLPHTLCIYGGPEATYRGRELLSHCDILIKGEGEKTIRALTEIFSSSFDTNSLMDCMGLIFRHDGKIHETPTPPPADLNDLIFPYYSGVFEEHKIIYYESSRGCPYNCGYCLSSAEKGVRFLRIDRVYKELKIFLDNKVKQVKFVDRTFNCDINRAKDIWNFLIENDNGFTNFHFEISADLMDSSAIQMLSRARQGLFQFEIGVQSTNPKVLDAVSRKTDLDELFKNVEAINELGNIHLHLDLIAGLPEEDYSSFKNSFNQVYKLNPQQLQLGFLKLLHGSALRERAQDYGLVYSQHPPYEILRTGCLSFDEILRLKGVEEMVEIYYNSGRYEKTLKRFGRDFSFYERLSSYYISKGYHLQSHTKGKVTDILFEYIGTTQENQRLISELIMYDIAGKEKINKTPEWFQPLDGEKIRNIYRDTDILDKYLDKNSYPLNQIIRNTAIIKFTYDVHSYAGKGAVEKKDYFLLFNYLGGRIDIQELGGYHD